ncbi:hypothetical protein [Roseobacter sp.]|uniref:hypothetical protein n=1 Tax=Roseobacter sp. TaxID=1907202 RepID=UPI002966F171|nr:hypothetical protein [Roseobacter sp.]MDW3181637.1 hypothetical protein [Roseobacter sp.]
MPKFSQYFRINATQAQLDFVDINTDHDTPVYVDPYAIEIRNDVWSGNASEFIRVFFLEVLDSLRAGDDLRAKNLMSHLHEPSETFLGVSQGKPQGRGVGFKQAGQMIDAIKASAAFSSGLLTDLSEMALYVENVDRDKISDLTTNIIREHLVNYTQQQCDLYGIPVHNYNGPPMWNAIRKNWESKHVQLPFIEDDPVILVPKYIVRKRLSLDSQEFYNKQITDFLVAEHMTANSSLVTVLKNKSRKVYKGDVRKKHPKSKSLIAQIVSENPQMLEFYKKLAKQTGMMVNFADDDPSTSSVCIELASKLRVTPTGAKDADRYHQLALGILTTCFYPSLIQPHKEWEINGGRKRIDIVFTNAADTGFFAHRRDANNTSATMVIVECKNYSTDINNPEIDQLLGRFDLNRGKFGFVTCRAIDNEKLLLDRCRDLAKGGSGYIIVLTDTDLLEILDLKSKDQSEAIEQVLHKKFRDLIS